MSSKITVPHRTWLFSKLFLSRKWNNLFLDSQLAHHVHLSIRMRAQTWPSSSHRMVHLFHTWQYLAPRIPPAQPCLCNVETTVWHRTRIDTFVQATNPNWNSLESNHESAQVCCSMPPIHVEASWIDALLPMGWKPNEISCLLVWRPSLFRIFRVWTRSWSCPPTFFEGLSWLALLFSTRFPFKVKDIEVRLIWFILVWFWKRRFSYSFKFCYSNFPRRVSCYMEKCQDFFDRCRRSRCCMRRFSSFCSSLASPTSIKSSSFMLKVGSSCLASLMLEVVPKHMHWSMRVILFRRNESICCWIALALFFSLSLMILHSSKP